MSQAAIRYVAARLADGFIEWQALLNRLEAKWANYSDFEPSGANANPVTTTFEDGTPATAGSKSVEAGSGGGDAAAEAAPQLRLDWEAAFALLAAANRTRNV